MSFFLAALIALFPTYLIRFSLPVPLIGSLPTTLLEILFLLFFAVWFLMRGKSKVAWQAIHTYRVPLALLFVGSTIGVLASPDVRAALGLYRAYIIEPILFFAMASDIIRNDNTAKKKIIFALGGITLFIFATALYQYITGDGIPNPAWIPEETRRATSVYGFPNAIGLFIAPLIPLFSLLSPFLFIAISILAILSLFFAVSEGAIIGASAGLLLLGLLHKKFRAATLIAIILGCAVFSFYTPATNYASRIVGLNESSSSVRKIVWEESIAMLKDHSVYGAGLAGYPHRMPPYHKAEHIEIFQYPHNIILNFWSEVGLIGLAGFLWLIILFFLRTAKKMHRYPEEWIYPACISAMATILVHGLVDVPYFKNDLAFLFFLIVALAESVPLEKEESV